MSNTDRHSDGEIPAATHAGPEIGMAQFAAIVDSADDAIVSKNLNGVIASRNKRRWGGLP